MAEKISFDEALKMNIPEFPDVGMRPANESIWISLLTDLAESLYTWEGDGLDFYDRLLIERFIHQKKKFCMVRPLYKQGKGFVFGKVRVMECVPLTYGMRNEVESVRLVVSRPPKKLVMEYGRGDFVLFDNFTLTNPQLLVMKYAEMLGKLDALYAQNIDKLGVPIIAIGHKSMKNDLLNLFKRTKLNALFTIVSGDRNKTTEIFYDAKIEYLLDKLTEERMSIMKEFIQELGINPNDEVANSSQYVNTTAIKESSLISKYFCASMNKYRDNFVDKCNAWLPSLNLKYYTTVKTYSEEQVEKGETNIGKNI